MLPKNKQLKTYSPHPVVPIISVHQPQPVIHIPKKSRPKIAFPSLILALACVLFLLAYAGPDIGNVLAYLVIPSLGFFPGLLVWERFGKVAGVLAGLLVVSVLTPAYGASVIANSISLFTSLQTISQGILVMFGLGILFVGGISIWLRKTE